MDETIITWNAANWITVLLMVIGGFALIALVMAAWAKYSPSSAAAASARQANV